MMGLCSIPTSFLPHLPNSSKWISLSGNELKKYPFVSSPPHEMSVIRRVRQHCFVFRHWIDVNRTPYLSPPCTLSNSSRCDPTGLNEANRIRVISAVTVFGILQTKYHGLKWRIAHTSGR
jgi:hypothetical protein